MSSSFARRIALCLLWVPLTLSNLRAQPPVAQTDRVDKLFAAYERSDSPGCALAVVRDGKVVYKRGYGMANLEHQVPITPATVFNIASVSKQFTCFIIMLLVAAGQLSLDDDIRKHIPELPDFGRTITIRHLLHHTSGLREDWSLVSLAGWRGEDVLLHRDVLALTKRQKELNFTPGDAYMYCNTGYGLMAEIVKRVSGKSLRENAQDKIFGPLGMKSSQFRDDYRQIIPRRASSYRPAGKGFAQFVGSSDRAGPSNLFTTVEDLARWDQNFYDPKVGGPKAIALMLQKGKLNSGKEIDYAAGLRLGEYRGLKYVEHLGVVAGYRAVLLRFPSERFSVILLANVSSFNSTKMSRQVADLYLADRLKPLPPKKPAAKVEAAALDCLTGNYRLDNGLVYSFTRAKKKLLGQAIQGKFTLVPQTNNEFLDEESGTRYSFGKGAKDENQLVVVAGQDKVAGTKLAPASLTPPQLQKLTGHFYSDELDVLFTVAVRDGQLILRHRKGDAILKPLGNEDFAAEIDFSFNLRFSSTANGSINGFLINSSRIRNLRFQRAEITTGPGK